MPTNPFDNPKELEKAFQKGVHSLGEIVYYFQQLEEEIRDIVAFLVNDQEFEIGRTVACELSFKQLLHMASSLAPYYYTVDPKKFRREWEALLKEAIKAEELRNSLLHSTFGVSWGEDAVFVRSKVSAKIGKGFKEVGEALTPEVMAEYRGQIGGLSLRITDTFGRAFPGWRTRDWRPNWDKK